MMEAKEYLESVKLQNRKVDIMRKNLRMLREALGIKSPHFESDGSSRSTRPTDRMAEAISKVIDYEAELKEEEAKLAILRFEVEKAIEHLEDRNEREVLKRKYLLFQSLETIMAEMCYSESSIYTFHRNGMKNFAVNYSNLQ